MYIITFTTWDERLPARIMVYELRPTEEDLLKDFQMMNFQARTLLYHKMLSNTDGMYLLLYVKGYKGIKWFNVSEERVVISKKAFNALLTSETERMKYVLDLDIILKEAAKMLGMTERTLYRKKKQYNL